MAAAAGTGWSEQAGDRTAHRSLSKEAIAEVYQVFSPSDSYSKIRYTDG
jgi:hypothetical protein